MERDQATLLDIARAAKMSDLEIRRIVYGLLQAGLVELIRPEGMPPPPQPTGRIAAAQPSQEEQRSLVNRLIDRIRSM